MIAKTLVDMLTLIFGVVIIVLAWRIPFFLYSYFYDKLSIRKALALQFKNALLDVLSIFCLVLNLLLFYQFPFTAQRLYYFTGACISHLIKFWKTKPSLSSKSKTENTTPKEDNGEILPSDMMFEIFTFLSPEDNTKSADRACKYWHEISREDPNLWKLYLDMDVKKNLVEQKFSKKYAYNAYNTYSYNTTPFHENYYSAIGSYKSKDFSSVFREAFGDDTYYRKEYAKRYVDIRDRYVPKQCKSF